MSLTYIFKTGKHKDKQISWVKKNDFKYLKDVNKGKVKIKLTQRIKDFIEKMCEDKIETSTVVVDEVIQLYKEGNKRTDIHEILVKRDYTPDYANFIINSASSKIIQGFEEDKSYLIGLHLKRYDSTHNKHMDTAATLVGFKHKYKRIEHYILAMDSLIAKERLLGLHSKKYNIQLNNFINRDRVQSTSSGYSFDSLSTKELTELAQLIAETKVAQQDKQEIQLFDEAMIQTGKIVQDIVETIEDIDHEEVESPLTKVHHKDIFGSKLKEVQKKTGNTIDTVEDKIRQSNKSAFELIMNKQKNEK